MRRWHRRPFGSRLRLRRATADPARTHPMRDARFRSRLVAPLLRGGVALALALAVVAGLTAAAGEDPAAAIRSLFAGAFGSLFAWKGTLARATPILFTGLAVAWALRGGLFNIGAEGQLLWGATAAAWVGTAAPLPAGAHPAAALLAGAAAGAL